MLTYELIVSTMNQKNDDLIKKMNINSNAIIINQTDVTKYQEIKKNKSIIKMYSFNEKGIGLSRNNGLMRATADIIHFADEDMTFVDDYQKIIINEYVNHPEADVILFSNKCLNKERMPYLVSKFGRVRRIEAVKFGGARITARREKILYNNIFFSILFGGGAKYSSGEDVTFIQDCIKAGLKVYKSPIIISTMKQDTSTWFSGYTEKYYKDKGALLGANFPHISIFYVFIHAFKKSISSEMSYLKLLKLYYEGMKEYKDKKKKR